MLDLVWMRERTCLTALGAALLAVGSLQCGRSSSDSGVSGGSEIDAGTATDASDASAEGRNECAGRRELRFGGRVAHVGDACGECADGVLICGSPDLLLCYGAKSAAPNCDETIDSGVANDCGGFVPLVHENEVAQPGSSCGRCNSGLLVCVTATQLGCAGENAAACGGDGGSSGGGAGGVADDPAGGVAGLDSGDLPDAGPLPDGGDGGGGGGNNAPAGNDWPGAAGCVPEGLKFEGKLAAVGDRCGPCGDGYLACQFSTTALDCVAATPPGYCNNPEDAPNTCNGKGPMKWRDIASSIGTRCGACNKGYLACASQNVLTCITYNTASLPVCSEPPSPRNSCAIPSSAYSAPALHTPPAPAPEAKPAFSNYKDTGIHANAVVYNAYNNRLYVSVPGSFGMSGNSVAVFDPTIGQVEKFIPIGSEPNALALSDDGQWLWVVNSGAKSIRALDLTHDTVGPAFSVAMEPSGVTRIAVLPGSHDSLLMISGSWVSVYDNGIARPNSATMAASLITTTQSPLLAYAFNDESSSWDLTRLCVNGNGVFAQQIVQQAFGGNGGNLSFYDGFLYGGSAVYDASKQSLVAQLPIRGSHSLDPANRRIFLLDQNAIHAVDMDTFVQLGTEYFSATSKYRPSFTRWGRYGFAFVGAPNHFDAGTLYIGLSRLIP